VQLYGVQQTEFQMPWPHRSRGSLGIARAARGLLTVDRKSRADSAAIVRVFAHVLVSKIGS